MQSFNRLFAVIAIVIAGAAAEISAGEIKSLRALLITGGCCHDYARQKDILKKGLEERANIIVDQIHTEIPAGASATKPPLPIYRNADYAKGYDVVIHDECAADVSDPSIIQDVLAPHRTGIPGVNLHCAMHSYRIGDPKEAATVGSERALWFEYLGLQSSGHGPQLPIAIQFASQKGPHPATQGLGDWTTGNEELYNNIQVLAKATPLARGRQTVTNKEGPAKENDFVVVWVNEYRGARVFSTTLGHNNGTVADPRYLDLVMRGVLWACGKLDEHGHIQSGYGPKR